MKSLMLTTASASCWVQTDGLIVAKSNHLKEISLLELRIVDSSQVVLYFLGVKYVRK